MGINAGLMIKKVRKERGLSQKEAARQAGITASLLSQIENSKINTSLNTLEKIGKALNLPVAAFLSSGTTLDQIEPAIVPPVSQGPSFQHQAYDPVTRKEMRPAIQLSGINVTLELLTPRVNRKFSTYVINLEKGQSFEGLEYSGASEQLIYVSKGEILAQLESGEYHLFPGYAIHFDHDNRLTKVTAISENEPVVLMFFSAPPVY